MWHVLILGYSFFLSSYPVIINFWKLCEFSPNEAPKQGQNCSVTCQSDTGGEFGNVSISAPRRYTTAACLHCGKWHRHHTGMLRLWKVTREMPNSSYSDTPPHSSCPKYTVPNNVKSSMFKVGVVLLQGCFVINSKPFGWLPKGGWSMESDVQLSDIL